MLATAARKLGAVPTFLRAKAAIGVRLAPLLDQDFRVRHAARDPIADLLAAMKADDQLEGRHPVDQSTYLWTRLALGGYILKTLGDGTEMATGSRGVCRSWIIVCGS